jgi:type VI secretion system secreted protein VgrG
VRVSQAWAGKEWGFFAAPRIGQEVIVEFLDGDPDRPIITGRVYNGKLLPPYDLPAQATLSGLRSRSSEGGDRRTFNELRFEDKKDSEEIYIHAQKDENIVVKHDKNEDVGHDETLHVANDRERRVDHDETLFIGNDQELDVGHDQLVRIENNFSQETGNQVRIVVGKSSITLNKDGTIIIDGVNVYVNGRQLSLRGRESFKYHSDNVTAVARTEHVIRGASVRHNP